MSRKHRLTVLLVVLSLVVLISQSTGAVALAQSGEGPSGSPSSLDGTEGLAPPVLAAAPGGPGFYSVNAFEFMPYVSPLFGGVAPNYILQSIYNPGPAGSWYEAPVVLPNGATVTKFTGYFYDNSAAQDMMASLQVCPLAAEGCFQIAAIGSSGASDSVRNSEYIPTNPAVINNGANSYMIEMHLGPGSDLHVLGFRIDYLYSTVAPLIMK